MVVSAIVVSVWLAAQSGPPAVPPAVTALPADKATPAADGPAFPVGADVDLPGLVDVGARVPVRVELKYGTTDNFMGRDVYGGLKRCFLQEDAVAMLEKAHAALVAKHPGWTFVMYDCGRPLRVQKIMWDVVKGTKQQGYVANPHKPPGSVHNRGCAVDLSVWDNDADVAVDMGTPYDFFGKKAQPRHEEALVKAGVLSKTQHEHRLALREAMVAAGFRTLAHEWWHFDCAPGSVARKRYPVIE